MNANEDIEKGVIVSDKAGIDVYKPAVGFVYAGREPGCRNRWAVSAGVLSLFAD